MAALGLYDRWLDERETQFAVVDAALTTREGRKPLPDLAKLSDLREYYTNNRTIQRTPDRDEAIHHWNEFHEIMVSEQKNLTSIKRGFPWQIWLQNGDHNFGTGINRNISTTLSGDFSGTVHKYDGIPNNSVIQLSHYTQSGKRFYLGTAKIELLDAIGSVPAIPKETKAEISAQRALDPRMYPNQWQRKMDKDRVLQIREWSDSDSKQMLINSIILYLPPHAFKNGVTLTQTGKLTIDFSKFLSRQGRNSEIYSDWKLVRDRLTREQVLTDRRPIWILDGQHRTRGMGISKKGSKLSVPITVLSSSGPGSVTTAEAAKIFTEINTNAESLHQRLELFLANRYRTTGRKQPTSQIPTSMGSHNNPVNTVERIGGLSPCSMALWGVFRGIHCMGQSPFSMTIAVR